MYRWPLRNLLIGSMILECIVSIISFALGVSLRNSINNKIPDENFL